MFLNYQAFRVEYTNRFPRRDDRRVFLNYQAFCSDSINRFPCRGERRVFLNYQAFRLESINRFREGSEKFRICCPMASSNGHIRLVTMGA